MYKDYFVLALNSLFKRKLRSWLTLLGIFIGIATVVALIGLGEGLREGITGQFNLLGNDVLTIQASGTGQGPPGVGVIKPLTTDDVDVIRRVPGVKSVFGRIITAQPTTYGDETNVQFIGSVPPDEIETFYDAINLEIQQGRLLKRGERDKIVVGYSYSLDDELFSDGVKLGKKLSINDRDYEVVGILKKKGSFIVDQTILIDEDELREMIDKGDEMDAVAAQVSDVDDIEQVREDIVRTLRRQRDVDEGEEDFTVETAASALKTLDSILGGVNIFVAALAGISIIVGGIGIANTMFTSVLERTSQIGVMKAIGARNSDIFWIFLIESGFLGLVGGAIGVIVGILLAFGGAGAASAALGSDLFRANITLTLIIGSLLGSFFVGATSGLIPAVRASKLFPVEALRYGK